MSFEIGIVGNPNTGKSTVFNALTNLRQHTGNWSGKTIKTARGSYFYQDEKYIVIDTPGTYSLIGFSEDEIIARDYVCFGNADAIIVICDASTLEKNLNLVLQILEYTKKVIMVVNFIDEARKNGVKINRLGLFYELGIPIVFTNAKKKAGIEKLKETISNLVHNKLEYQPLKITYPKLKPIQKKLEEKLHFSKNKELLSLRLLDANDSFFDSYYNYFPEEKKEIQLLQTKIDTEKNRHYILEENHKLIKKIISKNVYYETDHLKKTKKIDDYLTSRLIGIPIMLLLLFLIFSITIKLANIPTNALISLFKTIENKLIIFSANINMSKTLSELLIYGIYRTTSQVIAVMLPPMAIFFPLFTYLEDLGYLPRVAYNLDSTFQKCGCHGKQSLSMCMGFGCNASAIIGTRIIESKRDRLIAIVTNTFVPCNGRFPLIFTLASTFFVVFSSSFLNAIIPSIVASSMIVLGVAITLIVSKFLSKALERKNSHFTLEMPPFRFPNIFKTLYTSLINRTLFVLGRALIVAAPMGGIIYLLANTNIEGISLLTSISKFLNPFGKLLGMDGIIILAFILALPANEIVLPIILMIYMTNSILIPIESLTNFSEILMDNGWTIFTAINVLLFSLLHFPCSTTLLTIYQETKSIKWTVLSFLIPTIIAILICFLFNIIWILLF